MSLDIIGMYLFYVSSLANDVTKHSMLKLKASTPNAVQNVELFIFRLIHNVVTKAVRSFKIEFH